MHSIAAISLAFVLLLAGLSPLSATASPAEELMRTFGPTAERDDGRTPLATIPLGGGSELALHELVGEDGELIGIVVQRLVRAGGLDPYSVLALRGANPLELAHAFSTAGFTIPQELSRRFDNRFADYQRGWALGVATEREIGPAVGPELSCGALLDAFQAQVLSDYGGSSRPTRPLTC